MVKNSQPCPRIYVGVKNTDTEETHIYSFDEEDLERVLERIKYDALNNHSTLTLKQAGMLMAKIHGIYMR